MALWRTMLQCKIHRATVTQSELQYQGSISIDRTLIDAAGLTLWQQVDIYNITNGERFTTYVIEAPSDSGVITINGAAARKVQVGDHVIICAYCTISDDLCATYAPTLVFVDGANRIMTPDLPSTDIAPYHSASDLPGSGV